jgi:hypothetical protein
MGRLALLAAAAPIPMLQLLVTLRELKVEHHVTCTWSCVFWCSTQHFRWPSIFPPPACPVSGCSYGISSLSTYREYCHSLSKQLLSSSSPQSAREFSLGGVLRRCFCTWCHLGDNLCWRNLLFAQKVFVRTSRFLFSSNMQRFRTGLNCMCLNSQALNSLEILKNQVTRWHGTCLLQHNLSFCSLMGRRRVVYFGC